MCVIYLIFFFLTNKHFKILIETFQNQESNLKTLPNFWGNHIVNYHKKRVYQ